MTETFRMPCQPRDAMWVWPKDYTCVDLHLYDRIDDEVRVTFGRYLHVGVGCELTTHFAKSASQDVARLRSYLGEMESWDLWFGPGLLGGALVIAGEATAIIVPSQGRGESWDIRSRAIVAGCPTGGDFTIWRSNEELFARVATAEPYSGPALPPDEVVDEAIQQYLTPTADA